MLDEGQDAMLTAGRLANRRNANAGSSATLHRARLDKPATKHLGPPPSIELHQTCLNLTTNGV